MPYGVEIKYPPCFVPVRYPSHCKVTSDHLRGSLRPGSRPEWTRTTRHPITSISATSRRSGRTSRRFRFEYAASIVTVGWMVSKSKLEAFKLAHSDARKPVFTANRYKTARSPPAEDDAANRCLGTESQQPQIHDRLAIHHRGRTHQTQMTISINSRLTEHYRISKNHVTKL